MRRGSTLIEVLVAMAIGVVLLVVGWNAYVSFARQDAATRDLVDRLQTYAIIQLQLERDLEARCLDALPGEEGEAVVLPPHPAREGAPDGPRGAEPIRWEYDARENAITRNGKVVGMPIVAMGSFAVVKDPLTVSVRAVLQWQSVDAGPRTVTRIVRSWPIVDKNRVAYVHAQAAQ